jgi:hypothetical protein
MTRARRILVVAVLAVHAAGVGVRAAVDESVNRPEQSAEINVNPYGDPIWQSQSSRPRPRHTVKRSRSKPHLHAKRIRARPHGFARATPSKLRHPKPAPIARPLNILPPAARAP